MKHLSEKEVYLEVTMAAKDWLAKEGFDKTYGARPLRRVITSRIEDPLSEQLLRGTFAKGDTLIVDADENGITLIPKPKAKEPASTGAEATEG
jgi:ATP-dependent Clp protease ATP-binding subunit ClpC